jgi:Kef-type K+ transport system membrane component KefB
VLKDLGKIASSEARIILGAAVIDDVLGLIVLAVITGTVAAANAGVPASYGAVGVVLIKAAGFLIGALLFGVYVTPRLFFVASKLKTSGVLLTVGLSFCFVMAWLAERIGLAPIVGAFAAGLVLEELHHRPFKDRGERSLEELLDPITAFLAPIFFVLMGMSTDLRVFGDLRILGLAAALTLAAIAGKQLCALGAPPSVNRL